MIKLTKKLHKEIETYLRPLYKTNNYNGFCEWIENDYSTNCDGSPYIEIDGTWTKNGNPVIVDLEFEIDRDKVNKVIRELKNQDRYILKSDDFLDCYYEMLIDRIMIDRCLDIDCNDKIQRFILSNGLPQTNRFKQWFADNFDNYELVIKLENIGSYGRALRDHELDMISIGEQEYQTEVMLNQAEIALIEDKTNWINACCHDLFYSDFSGYYVVMSISKSELDGLIDDYQESLTYELENELDDCLPSGSGFNCDWDVSFNQSTKKFICKSSYQVMSEVGYYDGFIDFTVKIPFTIDHGLLIDDMTLVLNGRESHRLERKYYVREYIDEAIFNALKDNFNEVLSYE